MHRSSETIGAIAAALAKAQAELTNPEKSLVATIRSRDPRDGERTFRYAPLSSGLEIVRKALGQHEIATIQTTAIDREAGLIRLTTVLAHSSGEWMSSEWPVCQIADAGAPQRMGAALTYARRYGLFTLVGIAGEDDLDAPDLAGGRPNGTAADGSNGRVPFRGNGHVAPAGGPASRASDHRPAPLLPHRPILDSAASVAQRDELLGEIEVLATADDMAAWAQRMLPAKNTLRAEDAAMVEGAFAAALDRVTAHDPLGTAADPAPQPPQPTGEAVVAPGAIDAPAGATARAGSAAQSPPSVGDTPVPATDCDCADLAFGKTRRKRDKDHRAFVATKPCLVCGRRPADAHHLRFAQPRALGRKVSDEFTVPLCRIHHRDLHLRADEAAWWKQYDIKPLEVAQRLWSETRGAAMPIQTPPPSRPPG